MNLIKVGKKLLAVTLMTTLMIPTVAFGASDNANNKDVSTATLLEMKEELKNNGFSKEELSQMSNEIPELYEIVTTNTLNDTQLQNLKETFTNIHEVDETGVREYPVDGNGIIDLGEYRSVVPNNKENVGASTMALGDANSGPHAITYTNPTYKFDKVTGYVDLPSVEIGANPANYARPYVFFGAYYTISPYPEGFDAGLVYYQEDQTWRLFRNIGGDDWKEKYINLKSNEAYLWMELNGSNTLIKVIDPVTWEEAGSLSIPVSSLYSKNPNSVEITREVSLAQQIRADNGDCLRDAHWHEVHYYRSSDGFHTEAKPEYLQSSHSERYQYSSSFPKFLIGDDLNDLSKINIRPEKNYSAEWIDIILN